MSAARGSRNNVMAGVFVIAAASLLVVVVVVMSNLGDFWTKQSRYTVRFSVTEGVEGLDEGAQVKIGGLRAGKVLKLTPRDNPTTGEPEATDVEIQIPARVKIYTDADVQLIRPLLGTGSTINIQSPIPLDPDTPQAPAAAPGAPRTLLQPGETIVGHLGPPGFMAPADYARVRAILARADNITRDAAPQIKTIMGNADASVANIRNISDDLKAKWPVWSGQVSSVIERVEKASRQIDSVITSAESIATSVREGVAKAEEFIDKTKALIEANRAGIDRIVKNIESLTEKANTEWAAKINTLLDEGAKTLEAATATAKEAQDLVARNGGRLDDIVANAGLAAQQLKLAMVEIRASPWRLLYQPSKRELENELLYNTVRQYSEAVGQLKAAADDLKTLSQRSAAGGPVNQAQVDAMSEKLRKAFAEYQERERAFLERWSKQGQEKK